MIIRLSLPTTSTCNTIHMSSLLLITTLFTTLLLPSTSSSSQHDGRRSLIVGGTDANDNEFPAFAWTGITKEGWGKKYIHIYIYIHINIYSLHEFNFLDFILYLFFLISPFLSFFLSFFLSCYCCRRQYLFFRIQKVAAEH